MNTLVLRTKRVVNKVLYKLRLGASRPLHRPTIQLHSRHHGTEYGGWRVFPDALAANSIIYSFGIGEDASFDREMMQTYGAAVFAFDPTPKSIQWVEAQQWPEQFSFYPYGIAAKDGAMEFYPPHDATHISHSLLARSKNTAPPITVQMMRLETIVKMLGHSQIDLLKMDIEGAEFQVIPDILSTPGLDIRQMLVEFHHDYPEIPRAHAKRAVQQLLNAGYDIFYVAPNGKEYSFIQRRLGIEHTTGKRHG